MLKFKSNKWMWVLVKNTDREIFSMPNQLILIQIMTKRLGESPSKFDSYLPVQPFLKVAAKSS